MYIYILEVVQPMQNQKQLHTVQDVQVSLTVRLINYLDSKYLRTLF